MLSLPLKWQVTDPAFTWALHINKGAPETNMPSPSTSLASLRGSIQTIVFSPPPVPDSSNLVISQRDWWTNLGNCVHLISCLLLRKWNGTAIKHEKPLAAVRHHTGFLSCDVCNVHPGAASLTLTGQCWFIELFFFLFFFVLFWLLFSHRMSFVFFRKITDPTEKNGPIILRRIILRCSLSLRLPPFPFTPIWAVLQELLFLVADRTGRKWVLTKINGALWGHWKK